MGARIIHLAEIRARRAALACEPKAFDGTTDFPERFHFWSGASGRRYVHTVYSLLECPALPAGNYMLVHRGSHGLRRVLEVGRVAQDAASLNLAEIRRRGALAGANEVHIHLLAETDKQSEVVELDLISAQMSPAGGFAQMSPAGGFAQMSPAGGFAQMSPAGGFAQMSPAGDGRIARNRH